MIDSAAIGTRVVMDSIENFETVDRGGAASSTDEARVVGHGSFVRQRASGWKNRRREKGETRKKAKIKIERAPSSPWRFVSLLLSSLIEFRPAPSRGSRASKTVKLNHTYRRAEKGREAGRKTRLWLSIISVY